MPTVAQPRPKRAEGAQALYTPLPKQQIAHMCPADEMLYGGAAGGGKSAWTVNDAIFWAKQVPGSRILILRRYTNDLQELVDYASTLIPEDWATLNQNKNRWVFHEKAADGRRSVVQFSHLNRDVDAYRHKSLAWDRVYFEEETTFTHFQRMYLRSRNRSTIPNSRRVIRGTTNPGDIGHQDVKDYFVRPPVENVELVAYYDWDKQQWLRYPKDTRGTPEPYIIWRPDMTPELEATNLRRIAQGLGPIERRTRCFIPATLYDNPYLANTDYQANLHELPPDERKALEEGDWDAFQGAAFKEFDPNIHVLHDPPQLKAHWRKWRSLDWGYRDPLCCLWHAYDPDQQQIITYRELYETELNDTEATNLIKSYTPLGEHIDFTSADPSMWRADSRDMAMSTAAIYQKQGVPLMKANNGRLEGKRRLHDVLAKNLVTERPGWVISSDCVNLIRELRGLVLDKRKIEDVVDQNDHAYDCARYGLLATPAFVSGFTEPVEAAPWR